jgi:integrase
MSNVLAWHLGRCRPEHEVPSFSSDPVLSGLPNLREFATRNGTRAGQEFLIRSDGRVIPSINAFLGSRRMSHSSSLTRVKYGRSLVIWMGYLDAVGCAWDEADEDAVDGFKFWRMTDGANPARVAGSTLLDNLGAINAFYDWAADRYGAKNPVARRELRGRHRDSTVKPFAATPHVIRTRDVKWLDPGGYACWRDTGLRGLDRSGREARVWRGRNSQRDCAFADGLYGTGLRLSEWASVLIAELPADDPSRGYYTDWLASACAKNSRGRRYWMPRSVLVDVLAYSEGERAAAVVRARQAGRYEVAGEVLVLERVLARRRVEISDAAGDRSTVSLDALTPGARARLLRRCPGGLEPAGLWLNEDGLPRAAHGWSHTFDSANERVARAGLSGVRATAHMLRHSFALRWYSVGRLLYERRFAHLNEQELRDFRSQFGDTWYLVKTLLGHTDVTTTMNVYLEPFRDLDVSLLIEHAHGVAMSSLMGEMFAEHPLVISAPAAGPPS